MIIITNISSSFRCEDSVAGKRGEVIYSLQYSSDTSYIARFFKLKNCNQDPAGLEVLACKVMRTRTLGALLCGSFAIFPSANGDASLKEVHCAATFMGVQVLVPLGETCDSNVTMSNSLPKLLFGLLPEDAIVIDIAAGYGQSYFPLFNSLGHNGTVVAIEKSPSYFNALQLNAAGSEFWNRTLLIQGDSGDGGQDAHSVTSIVSQIGLGCPRLLRFNYNARVPIYSMFTEVLGAYAILEHCQPVLLMDAASDDVAGTIALVELLQQLKPASGKHYELYWHVLETVWSNPMENVSISLMMVLVAIPADHIGIENLLLHGTVRPVSSAAGAPPSWDAITAAVRNTTTGENASTACRLSTWRTSLSVDLLDVLATDSSIAKFLHVVTEPDSKAGRAVLSLKDAGVDVLAVPYQHSETSGHDLFRLVSSAHCFAWRHTVHSKLLIEVTVEAQWAEKWEAELNVLQSACVAFVTKRFLTTNRTIVHRIRGSAMTPPTNGTNSSQIEEDGVSATPHAFYDASEADSSFRQWFERPPLEARHDEQVCGEPLWCGHTLEMQRRIRAWQYPEEVTSPLPDHFPEAGDRLHFTAGTKRLVNDWSVRENSSVVGSCAQSKFLVYEPPSNGHGIGSLLELIAVAFRYAICLDRILILNSHNQAQTLVKWMHPGCQGSFAECYFQPISGCTLSEAEVLEAPVSEDGYNFDAFPLRQARVLVLKGMPTAGECALCYSAWKSDCRFFDGLFTGQSTFERSVPLLHMAAMRGVTKLPWASQFLRYLLRPRAWLQEAISQLVRISMRSPTTASISTYPDLPTHAFPRRFISLHVRFGMKVVEATLQPLSKYMGFIARKLPDVVDIFVSTETEEVIHALIREYPQYRFHYMHYPRREYLDLALAHQDHPYNMGTDFVDEFLYSLANLHVAAEASAFVGTLSSNWCMMIMQLERTRGDGGYDYYSMDKGSSFTGCF